MYPYIVIVQDGIVDEMFKCIDTEQVEKRFLDKCEEYISNWNEYTSGDIECILDDGYEKFINGSINIVWC